MFFKMNLVCCVGFCILSPIGRNYFFEVGGTDELMRYIRSAFFFCICGDITFKIFETFAVFYIL